MARSLTERELEVASLIAQGLSSSQIGKRLGTTPETVQAQARSIYSKWGVKDRNELAFLLRKSDGAVAKIVQDVRRRMADLDRAVKG